MYLGRRLYNYDILSETTAVLLQGHHSLILRQITESVSPNGHFPNLSFTKTDKSQKSYPEDQLPKRKDISLIIFSE